MSDFTTGNDSAQQPAPVPPQQKRGGAGKIVAAVVAVLLVAGGAAYALYLDHQRELAAAERAEQRQEEEERREAEAAAEAEERAAAQRAYDVCVSELSPLLDDLTEVDARLDVGLSYDDYSELVGDASVSYERMDTDDLDGDCLSAGVELETALNKYSSAASTWNDCIWDDWCNNDSIDPQLQRKWRTAAEALEEAETKLEELDPANGQNT